MTDSPNYAFVCDYIIRHFPKGIRILDFGCGDGSLCALLMKEGFNVSGVEILEEKSALLQDPAYSEEVRARFKYGNYLNVVPFGDNTFDVDVANVVFDHIQQRGNAQTQGARVTQKIRRAAEIKRRGHQHAGLLAGDIRQRQWHFDVGEQAQITVLFTGPQHQH